MGLKDRHVVVVGGGIGGAATALLSARAGARVSLLEHHDAPRTVPTGIVLQPNALAVLYGLDLDERLLRRGVRLASLRVADERGRTIVELTVPHFADSLDHALVIPRDELSSALFDLIAGEPRIECRFGTEVVEAAPGGEVVYRDRTGTHRIAGDVVVGADGVHSSVRRRSGIAAEVGCGFRYVRGIGADVPAGAMTEYWTGSGIFGVAPLRRGTYFYASSDAGPLSRALEERDLKRFREAWRRELPVAGAVLDGVAQFEDLVASYALRVDCARWWTGRIVLLGDAAHAMAPNLGQGAGSALTDAAVLAWELAQPGDVGVAFARYERRRRAAVREVQDLAGLLGRLSDVRNPLLRSLRDRALRLAGRWLLGEVGVRLLEQQDPLSLRIAAEDPAQTLALP